MAYKKPGIEVLQKQVSTSPILSTPELETCVVGMPIKWYTPSVDNDDTFLSNVTYDPSTNLTINASGVHKGTEDVIDDSIIVDLIQSNNGQIKHLKSSDYTYNSSTGEIVISSGLTTGDSTPIVGLATKISGMTGTYKEVNSITQLEEIAGEVVSWNPLGFGAAVAMSNSGSSTNILGIEEDTSAEHTAAFDELELNDPYVIAPMSQKHGSLYKSHVTAMSTAEVNKKRIAFVSPEVDYSSGDKETIAENIRDANAAIGEKRYFSIHPDVVYVRETRHVSTLRSSFSKAFFGSSFSIKPLFASKLTVDGSTKYQALDTINDSDIDYIIANSDIHEVDVYTPLPGYYYSAMIAGMVINRSPQEPLTDRSGVGLSKIYRSNTYFPQKYLNTMAEGGTFILTQDSRNAPISCRHQLSTDNSSVEKSELSITTAVDYVSIYLTNSLKRYTGRFNITPQLLGTIRAVFEGLKKGLMRRGIVNDITLDSLEQDSISKDTVNMVITITPLYPANTIKITLQF